MLAAVEKGDAKELAKLILQNPGFKVNKEKKSVSLLEEMVKAVTIEFFSSGGGCTLLHHACLGDSRS